MTLYCYMCRSAVTKTGHNIQNTRPERYGYWTNGCGNSCVNSLEDGPVGPKHVEIRLYMNKIETVTSVGFSFLMCRSWQDCCRRGENRSWPSVLVESVDSECWCFNNAIFLRFHNAVNSGRMCIYFRKLFKNDVLAHCRQSFLEKFRSQAPVKSVIEKMIKKFCETGSLLDKNRNRLRTWWNVSISALKWMDIISNTYSKYRLVV